MKWLMGVVIALQIYSLASAQGFGEPALTGAPEGKQLFKNGDNNAKIDRIRNNVAQINKIMADIENLKSRVSKIENLIKSVQEGDE